MATTHTIEIKSNPALHQGTVSAKRVSESRVYKACVVATATQALVDDRKSRLAAAQTELTEQTALLETLVVRYGITLEAAKVKHKEDVRVWFDLRKVTWNQILGTGNYISGLDKLVDAKLATEGVTSPYAPGTYYDILSTSDSIRSLTWTVAHLSLPVTAGDQLVLTWSRDAGLAHKALAGHFDHYLKGGHYTLAVRTDITIR